jgi:hypothetical protein
MSMRKTGLAILVLAAIPLTGARSEPAIQCRPELPSNPGGHWTWRLIDGKRCWYPGRQKVAKSNLFWGQATQAVTTDGRSDKASPDGPEKRDWPASTAEAEGPSTTHFPPPAPTVPKELDFEERWPRNL